MPDLYRSKWFSIKQPNPNAKIRLFCFPYAGGNAQVFNQWHELLPKEVEVIGVQYPGRASRFADPLINRCDDMINALLPSIVSGLQKPFVFFGHSNGAMLSFELARQLQRRGVSGQLHHFLSAKRALHLPKIKSPMSELPDDQFLKELELLGGTPKEILAQRELMELFMPILRADFSLSEKLEYVADIKLQCSASLCYGLQDVDVPVEDVKQWRNLIAGEVDTHSFDGDHFFINSHQSQLLSLMNQKLQTLIHNLSY